VAKAVGWAGTDAEERKRGKQKRSEKIKLNKLVFGVIYLYIEL